MAKKIRKYILGGLSLILFIFAMYVVISGISAIKNNKLVKFFGYSYSIIGSESMSGTIEVGDFIIIKDIDFETIVKDDIIVFYNVKENKNVAHRVYEVIEGEGFKTISDHYQKIDDDLVTTDNYLGKVVKYGNFLNIGSLILNGRGYLFLLVILVFIVIIVIEVINIFKNINEENKKRLADGSIDVEAERTKMREELLKEIEEETKQDNEKT